MATTNTTKIGQFITLLWDLGFQIGHSVRTFDECLQAGQADLSIATNLFESRLICGDQTLFRALQEAIFSDNFGHPISFLQPNVMNNTYAINVITVLVTILSQISKVAPVVYVTFIYCYGSLADILAPLPLSRQFISAF